jgi:hypothetical protein
MLLTPLAVSAAEYTANSVQSMDGNVKCFTASSGWFIQSTGPCKGFVPPQRVAIGETFEADGRRSK